jgi:hypothetical protein
MSVERCSICERDVDTDFEEGVYIGSCDGIIWICDNCDEGE